jgi:two-component system phosphate regulon sensor histidine kinase PhoR
MEEDWRLKFLAKEVRFRLELEPELPEITADSFRLEQVMHNLLENALKYTPAQGEVVVAAKASQGGSKRPEAIELRVTDTGTGIPPADLPHIFQRFYRADKARSRALGGTGLGLSIVKHIVQLHRGSVHAESTYGKGTAVVISLPTVHAPAPADNSPAAGPSVPLQ